VSRVGSPSVPGLRSGLSGAVVAVLEEPIHGGEPASTGVAPAVRKGRGWGSEPRVSHTGLFGQVKRPGGAAPGGGEDLMKMLEPEVWKAGVRGKEAKILYTSFLNMYDGLEEPSLAVQRWAIGGRIGPGLRRSWLGSEPRPGDTGF
jgi:hypothetical protein